MPQLHVNAERSQTGACKRGPDFVAFPARTVVSAGAVESEDIGHGNERICLRLDGRALR